MIALFSPEDKGGCASSSVMGLLMKMVWSLMHETLIGDSWLRLKESLHLFCS